MKKILLIEDRSRRKILLRTILKVYNYETYIVSADELNRMIEDETPDYVYVNIKEPAKGEDMKSLFENLRSDHRLRVRVIDLSNHKLKFSKLFPFEKFDTTINIISEKISKGVWNSIVKK